MLNSSTMKTLLTMIGLDVSVGCSYPTLVQLRWADVLLGLDSSPNVDVDEVIVVDDDANHANLVDAILSPDDSDGRQSDDLICPADVVVVLFLSDVVVAPL